jgi:zinc transport system substrate-binding protein
MKKYSLLTTQYPLLSTHYSLLTTLYPLLIFALLALGCGTQSNSTKDLISVSIVPQKYFVEQIAGDDFEVNIIIPPGASHSHYDPSPSNMTAIGNSVAYFRIGDVGFEQALLEQIAALNPDLKIYDLSKGVHLMESPEVLEDAAQGWHQHHHGSHDQHIWMSARKAKTIAKNIYKAVSELKPERDAFYRTNLTAFLHRMDSLDAATQSKLADLSVRAFVIFHPALTYYAEDYGLEQIALEIDGKEPSVAWMQEVVKKIEDKNVRVIFIQNEYSQAAAVAISETTGVELQVINPLAEEWQKEFEKITDIISEKMK